MLDPHPEVPSAPTVGTSMKSLVAKLNRSLTHGESNTPADRSGPSFSSMKTESAPQQANPPAAKSSTMAAPRVNLMSHMAADPHAAMRAMAAAMAMNQKTLRTLDAAFMPGVDSGALMTMVGLSGIEAPVLAPTSCSMPVPVQHDPDSKKRKVSVGMPTGLSTWRKYGQKRLKGKEFEGLDVYRCYYRCTVPGCEARKQTEKQHWQDDSEAEVVQRSKHNHPDEDDDAPSLALRIVQTRVPNMPRIDNSFISRYKKSSPFWTLLDISGDPKILLASDDLPAATGYGPAEVLNKSLFFMRGKKTDPAAVTDITRAIQERSQLRKQIMVYKKSGEPMWVEMLLLPLPETTHGYLALQTDITHKLQKKETNLRPLEPLNSTAAQQQPNPASSEALHCATRCPTSNQNNAAADDPGSGDSVGNSGNSSGGNSGDDSPAEDPVAQEEILLDHSGNWIDPAAKHAPVDDTQGWLAQQKGEGNFQSIC